MLTKEDNEVTQAAPNSNTLQWESGLTNGEGFAQEWKE